MTWFDILKEVRKLGSGGSVTAAALAARLDMKLNAASAWLAKLAKWGYLNRVHGDQPVGRGRPPTLYELTKYGMSRKAPRFVRVFKEIDLK